MLIHFIVFLCKFQQQKNLFLDSSAAKTFHDYTARRLNSDCSVSDSVSETNVRQEATGKRENVRVFERERRRSKFTRASQEIKDTKEKFIMALLEDCQ